MLFCVLGSCGVICVSLCLVLLGFVLGLGLMCLSFLFFFSLCCWLILEILRC